MLIHLDKMFEEHASTQVHTTVMEGRLNFIINHPVGRIDAFDAILPIINSSHIFTE